MNEQSDQPVTKAAAAESPAPATSRMTRIKAYFLYVLIAGIAAAALTSVIALLIGEFTSGIGKALLTIFVLFSHSLLILAVLSADRYNQVGKSLLPTSIVVLVFASIISSTLGIWEIISNESAWRALGLYFLAMGGVFVIVGLLKNRIAHQATLIAMYAAIMFIAATLISVAPWVLEVVERFDPLYFRIVAALSILATTALLISLVLRTIALSHNESLKLTGPEKNPTSGSMLTIYIIIGVITAIVWCVGFTAFLVSGVQSTSPYYRGYENTRYY